MHNLQSSLEAMKGSAQSLKEELGTDLLSQLSIEDQAEMDQLTDLVKTLTQQNKDSLKERIKVRIEPHHKKTCCWGLRPGNSYWPAQLMRLARVLIFWL